MHYYQFNIADYRKDTQHLTPMEHYIYRELMDWCYLDECEIPKNTKLVLRRLRLVSEYLENLENVLSEFFIETETGYKNNRIQKEIDIYKNKAETARANGSKGGRPKGSKNKPKKTQPVKNRNPEKTGSKPNQEPINKENIQKKKTSLPDGFEISDRVKSWAKEKGYSNLDQHFENFVLQSKSKNYQYVDWDSALMTAIRSDWAGLKSVDQQPKRAVGDFPF